MTSRSQGWKHKARAALPLPYRPSREAPMLHASTMFPVTPSPPETGHGRCSTPKDTALYVCSHNNCGKGFKKPHGLTRHQRIHIAEKPCVCPDDGCGDRFRQVTPPGYHVRAIHTRNKPFVCRFENCGYSSTKSGNLRRHLLKHSGTKPFSCPHEGCRYCCAYTESLKNHLRVHTREKPFACPHEGCAYVARQAVALTQHLLVHSQTRNFACHHEGCQQTFKTSGHRNAHLSIHSGEKSFGCPREGCGRRFRQAGNLRRHLRLHAEGKNVLCPYEGCTYAAAREDGMKYHRLAVHARKKPFVCPHEGCSYSSVQSSCLTVHLRTHSGEKPFACPQESCGRLFTRLAHLKQHLHVHPGEKPFVCRHEGCGRWFAQLRALTCHLRAVHAREKGLPCPHEGCAQGFYLFQTLKVHLATHTRKQSRRGDLDSGENRPRKKRGTIPRVRSLPAEFVGAGDNAISRFRRTAARKKHQHGRSTNKPRAGHDPAEHSKMSQSPAAGRQPPPHTGARPDVSFSCAGYTTRLRHKLSRQARPHGNARPYHCAPALCERPSTVNSTLSTPPDKNPASAREITSRTPASRYCSVIVRVSGGIVYKSPPPAKHGRGWPNLAHETSDDSPL